MANAFSRLVFDPVPSGLAEVPRRFHFNGDYRSWALPAAIGAVALVIAIVGAFADLQRFFFAYLIGWLFCVSISVGAMFFLMINHVVKARWNTTIRRIPETLIANFPLLALAGLPIFLGMYDLFHWTHSELYVEGTPAYDRILAGKRIYLNTPFFALRYVFYFVVWSIIGRKLYTLSVRNDTAPDATNTLAMRRVSAWGIPLAAVTVSFASYDFLMSLDPHWFSTIFGVYFFSGSFLACFALTILLTLWFKRSGMLENTVNQEHLHDMGKWMFAFVVFWMYIFFSQYMLYWYANIPEETVWYLKRLDGGWGAVTKALFYFHFLIPFLVLLPRFTKRTAPVLAFMAGWLLVMHWMDLWWIAMPALLPHGSAYADPAHAALAIQAGGDLIASLQAVTPPTPAPEMTIHVQEAYFSFIDIAAWLGLFGLYLAATLARFSRHAVTPYNDPYFADSLRFENV